MLNTLFTGRRVISLESIDSTNNFAKELLRTDKVVEGTLISAREQVAGKGQAGNKWLTEPGQNLTVSYILQPGFLPVDKQFYLSMVASLAVRECCETLAHTDFHIKWPNDIYYLDEKIAGILIENILTGNKISSAVIGIGLNVNQTFFDISIPNATSLRNVNFEQYDLAIVRDTLSYFLEKYYLQLRLMHYNFIERAYVTSLYRYHQTALFISGKKTFRGQITGVSKDGKLLIESDGKEMRFAFKEVQFVIDK